MQLTFLKRNKKSETDEHQLKCEQQQGIGKKIKGVKLRNWTN